MKLNREGNTRWGIFDACGQQLPFVVGYDTETREVEMFIKVADEKLLENGDKLASLILDETGKPYPVKFILPGSYALDDQGNKY